MKIRHHVPAVQVVRCSMPLPSVRLGTDDRQIRVHCTQPSPYGSDQLHDLLADRTPAESSQLTDPYVTCTAQIT